MDVGNIQPLNISFPTRRKLYVVQREIACIKIPVNSAFRSVLIMQMSYTCALLFYSTLLNFVYEYLLVFVVNLTFAVELPSVCLIALLNFLNVKGFSCVMWWSHSPVSA